nr:MAG TPA: hypothetical protein [Caudoviricetes sp.]
MLVFYSRPSGVVLLLIAFGGTTVLPEGRK